MPLAIRSPTGQVTILGLIFLFVFTAYMTIQGFASQLYGSDLGSNMESTLYATFTVACFFAPAVTNKLGSRLTLFIGTLGYGALVAASFLLAVVQAPWCRGVVVLGGAILGVGAALLWTAQGRIMLELSDGSDQGRLFAIFWGIFNSSSIIGGFLTYFYFSRNSEAAPWPLYLIFGGCIVLGGAATGFLAPPHKIVGAQRAAAAAATTASPPPTRASDVVVTVDGPTNLHTNSSAAVATPANAGDADGTGAWSVEAIATLKLFLTRRMAVLSPLFWYTGFNQPYQLNTFGNRYFESQALGLQLASFYFAEVVGALLAGWMLDREASPRAGATRQLLIFALATAAAYALALSSEVPAALANWPSCNVTRLPIDDPAIVAPSAAFFLWGFCDSQVQAYCYWLIRQLYADGPELARAVGFYKMVQSLGWSIGFVLVPASRLAPLIQNVLTAASALVGACLALCELPDHAPRKLAVAGGERSEPLLDEGAQ